MTTTALNNALSGLRVAQKALDVTAANISNADTAGYTKKTLAQQSQVVGNMGVGVRAGEVQRFVDQAVQRDYRTQLGVTSFLSTTQSYLSRVTALHGSTENESNVAAQLGGLHDAFVALSATPASANAQNAVLGQATRLANTFNNLSTQMLTIRNDAEQQLGAEVKNLNTSLQNIATLNKNIRALTATGKSTAELEDQRDGLVKDVAGQLDVSYFTDGDNVVVVQTKLGQVLADDTARTVDFKPSTLTQKSTYPDISGLVVNKGQDGEFDLAKAAPGGRLGALLQLRDSDLPKYNAELDELAHKMMVRFDDQGLRLFTDQNGVVPPNDATAYAGIAGRMQVNAAVMTDPSLLQKGTTGVAIAAGSSAQILKIVDYTFGRFKEALGTPNTAFRTIGVGATGALGFDILGSSDATLLDFSTAMLDGQATDLNTVKSNAANEQAYLSDVEKRLNDGSSVNTDEEMGRMITLQKSYAASAKMISALDELFRDLLNAI